MRCTQIDAAQVGVGERLFDGCAKRVLRGDRSDKTIAGSGRVQAFYDFAWNGQRPRARPGKQSAPAEGHDNGLACLLFAAYVPRQ